MTSRNNTRWMQSSTPFAGVPARQNRSIPHIRVPIAARIGRQGCKYPHHQNCAIFQRPKLWRGKRSCYTTTTAGFPIRTKMPVNRDPAQGHSLKRPLPRMYLRIAFIVRCPRCRDGKGSGPAPGRMALPWPRLFWRINQIIADSRSCTAGTKTLRSTHVFSRVYGHATRLSLA